MADDATFEFEPEQRAAGEKPADTSTVPRNPRHQAARDLAAAGIPVFPCVVGGKAPAVERGFRSASRDLAQIDAWWAEDDYNVAFSPEDAGLCVVDVEADGAETWAALELEHGIVPTHEVTTPRGGVHYYYRGSLPASVQKLGDKVDTRGYGSYVLCPPSVVGGNAYQVAKARAYAPVPNWIVAALWRQRKALPALGVEEDRAENISRARAYLAGRGAKEGSRNDTGFRHAATLRDLGLSQQATLDMLSKDWECEPPLDPEELEQTVASAWQPRDGQNAAGAYAVQSSQEMFGEAVARLSHQGVGASSERSALGGPKIDFARFPWREPDQDAELLDLEFWDDDRIWPKVPGGYIGIPYGPTGSYKTVGVLADAMKAVVDRGAHVLFLAGEGSFGVRRHHVPALCRKHGIDPKDLRGRWRTITRAVNLTDATDVEALIAEHGNFRPDWVIVDTLATAIGGLSDNDANTAALFTGNGPAGRLRDAFGALIVFIAHTGKDPARGIRGSSGYPANVDFVLKFTGDRGTGAVKMFVEKMRDAQDLFYAYRKVVKDDHGVPVAHRSTEGEYKGLGGAGDEKAATYRREVWAAIELIRSEDPEGVISAERLARQLVPMPKKKANWDEGEQARLVRNEKMRLQKHARADPKTGKPGPLRCFLRLDHRSEPRDPQEWDLPFRDMPELDGYNPDD